MSTEVLRRWLSTDYYDILDLAPDATAHQITQAYRRSARRHHPDTADRPDAEAFALAREAYEVLGQVDQRARYDDLHTAARRYREQSLPTYDYDDVPEADRWVTAYRITIEAFPGAVTAGAWWGMSPWWQVYLRGWGGRFF